MKISVIIPVYNKAEYVEQGLARTLTQDFDDFEVIVVDDGSTDGSGDICDRMASSDSRLRVVHTANGGVTAARRKGVEMAQGRYVVFVDADDALLPGALKTLYETIEQTQADEVIARFRSQHGVVSPMVFSGFTNVVRPIWYIITGKNRFPVLWACIFRRELLTDVLDTPRDIIEGEDKLMQVKILVKRPKVYFSEACVYEYQVGLPNNRRRTLEREMLYDDLLHPLLAPFGAPLHAGFVLHQLKEYETFILQGQYDVRQDYYKKVITHLPDTNSFPFRSRFYSIPLYDRVVWLLPPTLSRPLIWLYKTIIKIKQRGL